MRLVTFRTSFGTRAGRLDGDGVTPLDAADVGELLGRPDWEQRALNAEEPTRALGDLDLAPVVPRPGKIICVGHNYRAHIEEMGAEIPEHPTLFAKFAGALVGPRDPIVKPAASEMLDWEVELAVVIGSPVRRADADAAAAAIAGYTVANDVTARDWQRRTPQWLSGKTFERTTPLGPALVTADEVDLAEGLTVRCQVDDRVVQESSTADQLFDPPALVAYVSQIITLEPGDVLLTGTPSGVGAGRRPPEFLAPGQTLTTSVEGLGECVNPIVAEDTR
jgi:acylpyruvate hydrolase